MTINSLLKSGRAKRDPGMMRAHWRRHDKEITSLFNGLKKTLKKDLATKEFIDILGFRDYLDGLVQSEITMPSTELIQENIRDSYQRGQLRAEQFGQVADAIPEDFLGLEVV